MRKKRAIAPSLNLSLLENFLPKIQNFGLKIFHREDVGFSNIEILNTHP